MLRRRRWPMVALLAAALCALLATLLLPSVGARYVRERVLPRAEERLGRKVTFGDLRIGWGRVEISELIVDGAGAPAPLTVPRAVVRYRLWPLLSGRVSISRVTLVAPRITVVRSESGEDNVSTILERLRARRDKAEGDGSGGGRLSGPDEIEVKGGALSISDDSMGSVEVGALEATLHRDGPAHAVLGDVELSLAAGPSAHAKKVVADFAVQGSHLAGLPSLSVEGGGVRIWKGFAVSGIQGGIAPDLAKDPDGRTVAIDLQGGYGGVDKVLWSAAGWARPHAREGMVQLMAKRFDLGQLAPILTGTPIIDPGKTEVDAHLNLTYHTVEDLPTVSPDTEPRIVAAPPPKGSRVAKAIAARPTPPTPQPAVPIVKEPREVLDFDGSFHLFGLSVFSSDLAPVAVRNIGFSASARGRLEPKARSVRLDAADVDFDGVKAALTVAAWNLGKKRPGKRPIDRYPAFRARFDVAPVSCQTALLAAPAELLPALQGFKLQGTFKSEVALAIDPEDLDSLELQSNIGIDGCRVIEAPSVFGAGRLQEPFRQAVEIEPGNWIAFDVGADNPDWVPYPQISPHLVNSIMTTEDSNFFHHKGFIGREFKSALRTNLERGYFRLGASSITMQMIKNVLLSREKTYSRKLQELFLTWYLERSLSKERILEIYFNVIEFGPGIYGIGRAARHYFGKAAKDLQPREAAWFSSILPNPKRRYDHYCRGAADIKWELYLNRILRTMHARGRLTDEELAKALDTRLTFDRAEAMSVEKCLEMVRRLTAQQKGTHVAAGVEVRTSDAPLDSEPPPEGEDTDDTPDPVEDNAAEP